MRDSYAQRYGERVPGDDIGALHVPQQPLGEFGAGLRGLKPENGNREAPGAQMRDELAGARRALQAHTDILQQLIAGLMIEARVDLPQPKDIDDEYRCITGTRRPLVGLTLHVLAAGA